MVTHKSAALVAGFAVIVVTAGCGSKTVVKTESARADGPTASSKSSTAVKARTAAEQLAIGSEEARLDRVLTNSHDMAIVFETSPDAALPLARATALEVARKEFALP